MLRIDGGKYDRVSFGPCSRELEGLNIKNQGKENGDQKVAAYRSSVLISLYGTGAKSQRNPHLLLFRVLCHTKVGTVAVELARVTRAHSYMSATAPLNVGRGPYHRTLRDLGDHV